VIDWAAYRDGYDAMTYDDVAAFHRALYGAYPDQEHVSVEYLDDFFAAYPQARDVVEIGGWRGSAAARILARYPDLGRWDNYEVCEPAVAASIPTDERYHAIFADRWVWEVDPTPGYDTAVLAHVIEHVNGAQLAQLIHWIAVRGVRQLYVEAPLRDRPKSWDGSDSTHVLELGWERVIALLARRRFRIDGRYEYEVPGRANRTVLFVRR